VRILVYGGFMPFLELRADFKMENIEPFETIYEVFEMLVAKYGALGIAAAMFAESAGVPFASAIVLITSGTMILRGTVSFWAIFWASSIGITLGSIFSYFIGMVGNIVGRKMRISYYNNQNDPLEVSAVHGKSKLQRLFERYGNFSIFMAQLWGFSRTFISFPAGAMHMNFYLFVVYTFLGGMLFSLIAIGSSIILTHTMGLILRLLKLMAGFSPWLLLIPAFLIVILILYLARLRVNKNKLNTEDCPKAKKSNYRKGQF